MPGEASLMAGQYYAHPRNAFWPVMGALLGFDAGLPYPERVAKLEQAGIALWDVLWSCVRRGSLDSSIVGDSEVANPIAAFLDEHPTIRLVACNGEKSERAFARHIAPRMSPAAKERVSWMRLPSTSPAHASINLAEKTRRWEKALRPAL